MQPYSKLLDQLLVVTHDSSFGLISIFSGWLTWGFDLICDHWPGLPSN